MLQYTKKRRYCLLIRFHIRERSLETHQLAANDVQLRCDALRDGACDILGFLLEESTKTISETYANYAPSRARWLKLCTNVDYYSS